MAERMQKDWITAYLNYAQGSESPASFITWSAISVLSCCLQRRCWWKWGLTTIFPNQYIIITGPAGVARKNEPIMMARSFLREVGVCVAPQRITNEALIRSLATNASSFPTPDGAIEYQCTSAIISGELSVFLRSQNIGLIQDLTDLYDCPSPWEYETKTQSTDRLVGVCVNLLGATAPDWLPVMLPQEAVGGGLTSRCLFVMEHKQSKIIPNPNTNPPDEKLYGDLIFDLREVMTITGEFTFTSEAMNAYENWYQTYMEDILIRHKFPVADPKLHSYVGRRATHLKKICMALSASRSNSRIVDLFDFRRAIAMLSDIEGRMHEVFAGVGMSPNAAAMGQIMAIIRSRGRVTRRDVMLALYRDLDAMSLRVIEISLEAMGFMRVIEQPTENNALYIAIGPGEAPSVALLTVEASP